MTPVYRRRHLVTGQVSRGADSAALRLSVRSKLRHIAQRRRVAAVSVEVSLRRAMCLTPRVSK